MEPLKILAVEDNPDALFVLAELLRGAGYEVVEAASGPEAVAQAEAHHPSLILLDIMMPGMNGFEVLRQLRASSDFRFTPIALLTAQGDIDDVVRGFNEGADDYIRKPYQKEELLARIHALTRVRQLYSQLAESERTTAALESVARERFSFANIIGRSPVMQGLFSLIEKVKDSHVPVLITGESGTGKELVAKALHFQSPRASKPFVAQNCSAFNEQLLESELFGHVRGSFTGAMRDKEGLFAAADGGTFFLDELGEMSPALQVKLLRVLQDGTFTPVGATKQRKVDVRIVAATNRNLLEMVSRGAFREDLYYRLNVVNIHLSPLRERQPDIPILVEHFLKRCAERDHAAPKKVEEGVLKAFAGYRWPGNIRELENEIERLNVMSGKDPVISQDAVSPHIRRPVAAAPAPPSVAAETGSLKDAVELLEREYISRALAEYHGNRSQAAKALGISRSNLISKIQEYGLQDSEQE